MPTDAIQCKPLEVAVADRGIERAIKQLKRKMATEGIMKELKRRRQYMKPSVKRRKKAAEAARRRRRRARIEVSSSRGASALPRTFARFRRSRRSCGPPRVPPNGGARAAARGRWR